MNANNAWRFVQHVIWMNPYLFDLQFCQHEPKLIKYNEILNYNQMIPSQVVLKKIPQKYPHV